MTDYIKEAIPAAVLLAAGLAAAHALLNKRDPRSAWGWIATCLLFPVVGAVLYWLFGINRIQRLARRQFGEAKSPLSSNPIAVADPALEPYQGLIRTGDAMSTFRLVGGNRITPLINGEQAYPAMLAGIINSQQSVYLSSYLFAGDKTGQAFIEALTAAAARGVEVKVLVDGIGDLFWSPRGLRLLKKAGLNARAFFPPRLFPPSMHLNLRNHRKLLIIDQQTAFVGGMNIGDHHLVNNQAAGRNADLHFRVEGPAVAQLAMVFAEDWRLTGGADTPAASTSPAVSGGNAVCRTITDGPNDHVDRLQMVLLGAMSGARHSIRIMTPYFSPTADLVGALESAALRGVRVQILLPRKGDQWWMDAAARRWMRQLARYGVQFFLQPAPFAHTKLFLVDDLYAQVGSANLDTRSLRLNFELMLEIYDREVAGVLGSHFEHALALSVFMGSRDLEGQSLANKMGDSACWLLSPYL